MVRQFAGAVAIGFAAATNFMVPGAAFAQGNGNGGSGNAGNGNAGNGNAGGNGKGAGKGRGATAPAAPSSVDPTTGSSNYISVVHSNGMRESLGGGRYEMRDAQGRVIVTRRATLLDYLRLHASP